MKISHKLKLIIIFSASISYVSHVNGAVVLASTRAALGGDDSVNWSILGPSGTSVPNPSVFVSLKGLDVSLSKPAGGFISFSQVAPNGSNWGGNFTEGDKVLWTLGTGGPVYLDFATPVGGGGAQIQRNIVGIFNARIEAFDNLMNSLGSFSSTGNSTDAADNSAIFIGINSDVQNISRIAINIDGGYDFAFNKFEIKTVPEPSSCIFILSSTVLFFRRRKLTHLMR